MPTNSSADLPISTSPPIPGGSDPATAPEVTPFEPHENPSPDPTRFDRILLRVARFVGLDRAVAFTLLARGWSSGAGLISLTLITHFLTRAEQGYYYTFYSLVALQIVFELGFSVVILQTASHEAAHLHLAADGTITGPVDRHGRLASVLQRAVLWYTIAAIAMALILYPVGRHFFKMQDLKQPYGNPVAWGVAWFAVVIATSCTFQIDPLFSFLEGCGYVSNVTRTRLAQAVLGSMMGWVALSMHHGLMAPACIIFGQAVAGAWFVWGKRGLLIPLLRHKVGKYKIDWKTEVWPFQWRIAISWLCGYFTMQLFNPILLNYRGPVEAGQMGMSMNICGTLSTMAVAWMNTKAQPLGRLISLKNYKALDRMFFRALIQSTLAATLSFAAVWTIVAYLYDHGNALSLRMLPPKTLALLFAGHALNVIVFAEAMYLRAHKQEKFMTNSILGALWMAPTAFFFGRTYGAYGIAMCYFWGTILIGIGYGTYTFLRYRKLWHAD
jgi:hypothetical protein